MWHSSVIPEIHSEINQIIFNQSGLRMDGYSKCKRGEQPIQILNVNHVVNGVMGNLWFEASTLFEDFEFKN
jgi:hypothetical protein